MFLSLPFLLFLKLMKNMSPGEDQKNPQKTKNTQKLNFIQMQETLTKFRALRYDILMLIFKNI